MANESNTVRIEIPAHPGSSIHITSGNSGQTIVTIEQSGVEANNVIKIIASPSKSYDEHTVDHDCGASQVNDRNPRPREVSKRGGYVYITESKDMRRECVESTQIVEPSNSLPPKDFQACNDSRMETNIWTEKTNQPREQSFVSMSPKTKDARGKYVETSLTNENWFEEEIDEPTSYYRSISSSRKTKDALKKYVESSQRGETITLIGENNASDLDIVPISSETDDFKRTFSISDIGKVASHQEKCRLSRDGTIRIKTETSPDERNNVERPKTRYWALCEADKTRRITRRTMLSRAELGYKLTHQPPSLVWRNEGKLSPRSPTCRNDQRDASRSPMLEDGPKVSRSPMSRVIFKQKPNCLSKIKTEPIDETDLCTIEKQTKPAIKKRKNISEIKDSPNKRQTRSSFQKPVRRELLNKKKAHGITNTETLPEAKRRHTRTKSAPSIKRKTNIFKKKLHEITKIKTLPEAKRRIIQTKSKPSIKRETDCSSKKQKLTHHCVEQNKQMKRKRIIFRRGKRKAPKNLNYILFKKRKVFVPNINIIKQLNLQCQVLLKPIRVVKTTNKHLNYRNELVEKLYSKLKVQKKALSRVNELDSYVHKLVFVLSSMKPFENRFLSHTKKSSQKKEFVQKVSTVNQNDQDMFDMNTYFDEAIQRSMHFQQVEYKVTELSKSIDQKSRCFLDASEITSLDFKKEHESYAGQSRPLELNMASTVNITIDKSLAQILISRHNLQPCFVIIGEENRAENILRSRALKYLQLVPRHGDISEESTAQPALRPYLLPFAWELPLHIYEHLRKRKLIKKPKSVARLVSQCKVTSSLHV